MILYHIILHQIKKIYSISRKYIPCQESIYHVHTAYCISRRHIPCPYSIFHLQKTYTMSIHHIPCPYTIFHLQKTYTMSQDHIPCLQSMHMASINIIEGPDLKNQVFDFFPDSSHDLRAMFGHHH